MKKIFNSVSVLLVLSFFLLPKLSLADAWVTTSSLTSTSVTLQAENLTPNRSVILSVVNKNSATRSYSEHYQTTSSSTGKATANFSGLTPNSEYLGKVYYEGSTTVVGNTSFLTHAEKVVEVKDVKDTSVTILAKNFPANKDITFNVLNYDLSTPTYSDSQDYMTDGTGMALYQFYGLSPGGHYRFNNSEAPGDGSFWTTGTPTSSGGNNNASGGDGSSGVSGSSDPNGLVPCGTTRNPTPCGFKDIMTLINTVINFLLFVMAVPIAAIMFAYAGFMLVFSGGASEKRSMAKGIFTSVAIGLVFAAAAWLIVHTVLTIVGFNGSWIGL